MVEFNRSLDVKRKAFTEIYCRDRKKYKLPFEEYEICFADGNVNNLNIWNILLLTPEEATEREMEKMRFEIKESIS